jgi:hypothetical protein
MRSFVGGNHKMVGSKSSLVELIGKLKSGLGDAGNVDVVIAPPTLYLDHAHQLLAGSPIQLSGQNCHEKPTGKKSIVFCFCLFVFFLKKKIQAHSLENPASKCFRMSDARG